MWSRKALVDLALVGLALVLALSSVVIADAQKQPGLELEATGLESRGSIEAEGDIQGTCEGVAIAVSPGPHAPATITAEAITLHRRTAWVNRTILMPGTSDEGQAALPLDAEYRAATYPLDALAVTVLWTSDTPLVIEPGAEPMDVRFTGLESLSLSRPASSLEASFWLDEDVTVEELDKSWAAYYQQHVFDAHRLAETKDGSWHVTGNMVVPVDGSRVSKGDDWVEAPSAEREVTDVRDPSGTTAERSIRYERSFLEVINGAAAIPAPGVRPACSMTSLTVNGTVWAAGVTGEIPGIGALDHQMLSGTGSFELDDEAREGARGAAVAWQGQPRVMAVDLEPVPGMVETGVRVATASLAASVVFFVIVGFRRAGGLFLFLVHRRRPRAAERGDEILTLVAARPGLNECEIAQELGISRGSVRHALRSFEGSGHVTVRRIGRVTAVAPAVLNWADVVDCVIARDQRLNAVDQVVDDGHLGLEASRSLAIRFEVDERTIRKWHTRIRMLRRDAVMSASGGNRRVLNGAVLGKEGGAATA